MTKKRYVRLKLKMLLMVVLGAVVAGALGLFLKETVVDGLLEDPFASFFVWIATHLFGQTQQVALDAYQHYIRSYKAEWVLLGTGFLMLIAFYLAMGRFTRWLDQIASATAQVADLSAEAPSPSSVGKMWSAVWPPAWTDPAPNPWIPQSGPRRYPDISGPEGPGPERQMKTDG